MPGTGDVDGRGKDGARRAGGRRQWPGRFRRAASGARALSRGWSDRITQGAAWLALLFSLALTLAAWRFADAREHQATRVELGQHAAQVAARLSARMLAYEQLLRGAAGLFAASGTPSREEWRAFVGALGLASLPGIEGLGWAPRVPVAELGTHVDAMRRGGVPDYRVFPVGPDEAFGPVAFIEPFAGRNVRALGFDMLGEPVRRVAMQTARDGARPSLTARVVLVQEGDSPQQPGFLVYLPVYRQGAPTGNVEQRRAALLGWVYAAFRAGDFVEGAVGDTPGGPYLEVLDARGGAPLHASPGGSPPADADEPALRVPLPIVDREWEIGAWPVARPDPGAPRASVAVAAGGTIGSLLIFGIVLTLAGTRSRAVAIADRMTAALRQANDTLESRVMERTASLRDSNQRLASVNDKLRAVNAAFGVIGAPGPIADRLAAVAAQLRTIVPSAIALAVAFRAEPGGAPAIGMDADAALPSDERDRWQRAAAESDRSGEPPSEGLNRLAFRLEAPLLDAHGRSRGYLLLGREASGFAAEDTAVLSQFALLVGTSLSLHETLARERHARTEAERADRAKEEMLAVVSHELRTPLNAIQGWLHVLRRRRSDDAALLDRALAVIQRNLDTQVQLVDDLLDTARIASGKLRLELRPLDLVPLLRTAVDTVRPLAEGKRIALSLDVADGAFVTVGDAARLEQVVWNLLNNAVKFTHAGGRVEVRLARIGWLAQLEVVDDGRGIEPEFLPHVFDRFRQADSSSTRVAGGLGLGLALVHDIVQGHGGQVTVRSDGEGRGACFTVSLPLGTHGLPDSSGLPEAPDDGEALRVDPPRPGGDAQAAVPPRLAGLQVLVVEDHDDSRELLAEFLSAQGATVRAAANGHEAMAALREPGPHDGPAVLLCDIALPGENGYALLARIRRFEDDVRRPASRRLVAFAISAFTRQEDRDRSLQAGFVDHLGKPLSQPGLVERLARLLDDDATPPARH